MDRSDSLLQRIADALERLAPPPPPPAPDLATAMAMGWADGRLRRLEAAVPLPAGRFRGVDAQMAAMRCNMAALARGAPAHDMLLWGARGMGKSALTRTLAAEAGLALVETTSDGLASAPALFRLLAGAPAGRAFLLFVDDLAFDSGDAAQRLLRSLLDGGVAARPAHVRLVVTSNHRHLLRRSPEDSSAPAARHQRDQADDELALVDRFGLVLGFHPPDQQTYLAMVESHLAADGLAFEAADALAFALARGGRSGRTAWHFRTELLARRAAQTA